jgi:Ribonuclease G/E
VIIRTAASGRSEADIVSDLSYFHEIWTEVRRKMENRRPPAVLFQEQSLVTKLLRDMLTDDYTAIRLDDEAEHRRVVTLVERIMPTLLPRVKIFEGIPEYGIGPRSTRRCARRGVAQVGRFRDHLTRRSSRQHRTLRRQMSVNVSRYQ